MICQEVRHSPLKKKAFFEGKMHLKNFIKNFTSRSKVNYSVGQRLRSNQSKSILVLKREVYISGIRHYSISVENEPWKRTELLSEHALRQREFLPI